MTISFIDPLLALPGQDKNLFAHWRKLVSVLNQYPDLQDARLLEALDVMDIPPLGPFTHVALIEWTTVASLKNALAQDEVKACLADLRSTCLSHSRLFGQVSF
jgi:hypothetical protein